jgi:hypothetical protein
MTFFQGESGRHRSRFIISFVLAAILALLIWQVLRLRPPSSMRLATGPEGEHEYRTAQIYQEYMAEQGVSVEIVPTAGSLETMALIQAGGADAGFILNAANFEADDSGLVALAGVAHVPIWVFYRSELETDGPLGELTDLRGLRVSLGEPASGTHALSRLLLTISQIAEDEFTVIEEPPRRSAEMLLSGQIDAMFLASGMNAESLLELLLAPDVEILNFRLAETYTRLIPFLHEVTLLEGALNVAALDPPEDKHLLTDANLLIAGEDLHPDLQLLLLQAAREAQTKVFDPFPSDENFPSTNNLTLPVSETTQRFLEEGKTALQRYLPFWIASPLERFYLLVLPFLLLLYPLVRSTPSAYGFFMRRRVYVWYDRIREVEVQMEGYSIAELGAQIAELEALQQELTQTIKVSTGYLQAFYNLRLHIRLVIDRLRERKAYLEATGGATALAPSQTPSLLATETDE